LSKKAKEANQKPVLYSNYKDILTVDDNPQEGKDGVLTASCWYCGKRFTPTKMQARARVQALAGQNQGEARLYCSGGCKTACPTYRQKKIQRGYSQGTSREMQPTFRKQVLERDNWTCQRCGATDKTLHAHHILPYSISYDSMHVDDGITLCKDCHPLAHKSRDCAPSILFKSNLCGENTIAA